MNYEKYMRIYGRGDRDHAADALAYALGLHNTKRLFDTPFSARIRRWRDAATSGLTGNRMHGVIIDDPHNEEPMNSEVYNSTTHGPIKLSFTGRRLMANLRSAIEAAIRRGKWEDERHEVSAARGELAQWMSKLEDKAVQPAFNEKMANEVLSLQSRLDAAERENGYIQDRSDAWGAVVQALNKFVPKWWDGPGNGRDNAVAAIECMKRTIDAQKADAVKLRAQLDQKTELWHNALDRYEKLARQQSERFNATTRQLQAELDAVRNANMTLLSAQPPTPIMMQMSREVTTEQIDKVWSRLRDFMLDSASVIGVGRWQIEKLLKEVFDSK